MNGQKAGLKSWKWALRAGLYMLVPVRVLPEGNGFGKLHS